MLAKLLPTHLKTHSSLLPLCAQRAFSADADAQAKGSSNVFKGQHVRYIPKKRLRFDYNTPEGPMALVYQAGDANFKRANNWKIGTMIAAPATGFAYYTLAATQFWWTYPLAFLPVLFNLYDLAKLKLMTFKIEAHKVFLYQNGEQILLQTFDGMFHRLNVKDNNEHEIVEGKGHLVFVMNNSGREFLISNKDCERIDYDLVDRLIKGVPIDTQKFQKLYNRLLYRQTPLNLRPTHFSRFVPQAFSINESRTIWRVLNRTVYREDERQWLRNKTPKQQ